jgi:hypothetical protein
MRTATVIVMQDGSVQIVQKRTMVQVEAVIVVSIVNLWQNHLVNAHTAFAVRTVR